MYTGTILQVTLPLILVGLIGAFVLLVMSLASRFDKKDDEEEDSSHIEVATSGGGGHSSRHGLEDTIKAEVTSDGKHANVKVSARGKDNLEFSNGRAATEAITAGSLQCSHCGSINNEHKSRCWSCGSDPRGTLGKDSINTVNERIKQGAMDDSYTVEKGEEPKDHPVKTPATPEEEDKPTQEELGTSEDDVKKEEAVPIWRFWIGELLGWFDKWVKLTNTYMKSITVVSLLVAVFWGMSLIYGSYRLGPSGLISLTGASLIAVVSAGLMVLFALAPGRKKTALLAYPFAVNVFLLPPVVIAIYEPVLSFVWTYSESTAVYILDNFLTIFDLNTILRNQFDMSRLGYLGMWFVLSYPMGWSIAGSVHGMKKWQSYIDEKTGSIRQQEVEKTNDSE